MESRVFNVRGRALILVLQVALLLWLSTSVFGQYARPSARRRPRSGQDSGNPANSFSQERLNALYDASSSDDDERAIHAAENVVQQKQQSADSREAGRDTVNQGERGREAYVTMVTTTKYVVGAEVLAKSLHTFKANRPLIALVDSSLPQHVSERLALAGWGVEYIGHVENKNKDKLQDRPWFNTTFSKLHVFGMKDFDKVVFLDADILLLDNLDSLFDLDLSDDPSHPFAAASEVFPPDSFNSGVLVVQPSEAIFRRLLEASEHVTSYDGSDQGFLNTVFSGWWGLSAAHRLPFRYNVPQTLPMYCRPAWEAAEREGLAVLHFAGDDSMKPWSFSGVVPASLARYLFLWQQIARAPLGSDVANLYTAVLGSVAEDADEAQAVTEMFQRDAAAAAALT